MFERTLLIAAWRSFDDKVAPASVGIVEARFFFVTVAMTHSIREFR
ncbi:MAG: hypothetical protein P4L83_06865 [Nevskia sp.]|nr:hypothetical protein [Nevskia sp.]